jgi:hypothetical protein
MHVVFRHGLQEIVQSAGITFNKADVTSSNLPSSSCANMLKKKKKFSDMVSFSSMAYDFVTSTANNVAYGIFRSYHAAILISFFFFFFF